MIYKPSKLNYSFISKHDSALLLYNSLVGEGSLICVQNESDKELIIKTLEKEEIEDFKYSDLFVKKGFLIPFEEEEYSKLQIKFLYDITNPILRLTIMPTETCNFRCKYCYETHQKGKMSIEIQNAIIKYLRKNIHKYSALQVSWFGGEPLEALDIVENLSERMLKICKAAKKPYIGIMTTNGYELDINLFKRLLKLHIWTYQITLDGLKETHDKLRPLQNGQGTYDRILSNLLNIKSLIKEKYITIIIRTNFSKESFFNISQYIETYTELFSNDHRFQFSPLFMGKWNSLFDVNFNNELLTNDDKNKFYEELNRLNKNFNMISYNFLSHDSLCEASYLHSFVLGSDGKIYKCTADFELDINNLGEISLEGELVIDQSKHAKWIYNTIPHYCENCFFLGACQSRSCPKARIIGKSSCPHEKIYIENVLDMLKRDLFEII